jgi:hypothetical protein
MKTKLMMGVIGMTAMLAMSSVADAQGFGFAFEKHSGKHGKHRSFGLAIGFPFFGHSAPAPHCAPPVHVHTACCRTWVPGHFETRCEQVWVPGACRKVWVEPVYRTEFDRCGRPYQVLVACGHFETIQDPGHFETVQKQVWIEGFWQTTCGF